MPQNKTDGEFLVALDVGTSKVVALIAFCSEEGSNLEILGVGEYACSGLKRSMVVNIEDTMLAIREAVQAAEVMAGCIVTSVYVSIAGTQLRSINSQGMVPILGSEVVWSDIKKAISIAQAIPIPAHQRILHVVPQEFLVDGHEGIRDPLGMSGLRLEVKVHIVSIAITIVHNLIKCVQGCGIQVEELILQSLAAGMSSLSDDERDLGVCLVDIGSGTTELSFFIGGSICHTASIPIAGDHITNDIAVALRVSHYNAEKIKIAYGNAILDYPSDDEFFNMPGLGDEEYYSFSKKDLATIIQPRLEELFELVAEELAHSRVQEKLHSGIVLTGGGAMLKGSVYLAEMLLGLPVRIGYPRYHGPLSDIVHNPSYVTAHGLLVEASVRRQRHYISHSSGVKSMLSRMKNWLQVKF